MALIFQCQYLTHHFYLLSASVNLYKVQVLSQLDNQKKYLLVLMHLSLRCLSFVDRKKSCTAKCTNTAASSSAFYVY